MKRFRGGLVFKAHRLLYHSTLGLRVIKKKKKVKEERLQSNKEEEKRFGGDEPGRTRRQSRRAPDASPSLSLTERLAMTLMHTEREREEPARRRQQSRRAPDASAAAPGNRRISL